MSRHRSAGRRIGPFTALSAKRISPDVHVGVSGDGYRWLQRPVSRAFSLSWLEPLPRGTLHACERGSRPERPDGSSRCIEKTRERVSGHRRPVSNPDVNVGASIRAEKGRERPSGVSLLHKRPFRATIAHMRAPWTRTGVATVLRVGSCQPPRASALPLILSHCPASDIVLSSFP